MSQYFIAWFEDGEEGLRVGEMRNNPRRLDREVELTERIAAQQSKLGGCIYSKTMACYYWGSAKVATASLKLMKAAIKSPSPLEPWEQTALEAGWKPPSGWNGVRP